MQRTKKEARKSLLLSSGMGGASRLGPGCPSRRLRKHLFEQKHAADHGKQDVGELHELLLADALLDKAAQPG